MTTMADKFRKSLREQIKFLASMEDEIDFLALPIQCREDIERSEREEYLSQIAYNYINKVNQGISKQNLIQILNIENIENCNPSLNLSRIISIVDDVFQGVIHEDSSKFSAAPIKRGQFSFHFMTNSISYDGVIFCNKLPLKVWLPIEIILKHENLSLRTSDFLNELFRIYVSKVRLSGDNSYKELNRPKNLRDFSFAKGTKFAYLYGTLLKSTRGADGTVSLDIDCTLDQIEMARKKL